MRAMLLLILGDLLFVIGLQLAVRCLLWDNPTMVLVLDSKRRLTISAAVAPAAPGDQFDATFDPEEDVVVLRRIKRKKDWLAVLEACPVPMNDLPARSKEMPKKVKL